MKRDVTDLFQWNEQVQMKKKLLQEVKSTTFIQI